MSLRRLVRRDVIWPGGFVVMMVLGVLYVLTGHRILWGLSLLIAIILLTDMGYTFARLEKRTTRTRK